LGKDGICTFGKISKFRTSGRSGSDAERTAGIDWDGRGYGGSVKNRISIQSNSQLKFDIRNRLSGSRAFHDDFDGTLAVRRIERNCRRSLRRLLDRSERKHYGEERYLHRVSESPKLRLRYHSSNDSSAPEPVYNHHYPGYRAKRISIEPRSGGILSATGVSRWETGR
jgi:hypothetical protein